MHIEVLQLEKDSDKRSVYTLRKEHGGQWGRGGGQWEKGLSLKKKKKHWKNVLKNLKDTENKYENRLTIANSGWFYVILCIFLCL